MFEKLLCISNGKIDTYALCARLTFLCAGFLTGLSPLGDMLANFFRKK